MAYVGTVLSKSLQVSDKEFNLDQVKGKVIITNKVIIPAFQTIIVKRLTGVTGHQNCVHVLVESFPKHKNIFILGSNTKLKPGGSRVDAVLQNVSRRDIILEHHIKVGMVSAANKVPSMLTADVLE